MTSSLSSTTARRVAVGVSAALALALSACGDGGSTVSQSADPPSAGTTDAGAVSAQHNDVDVAFVQGMTPHHEGALAMAELAATRAGSPEVEQLAREIAAAQGPELSTMQAMADAWGVELTAGGGHGGGHGGGGDDAAALEPLSGAEFDRAFLQRMIVHHEGALPMSRTELADGENPQAQQLAEEIIDTQTAEIAEMEQLLTQL